MKPRVNLCSKRFFCQGLKLRKYFNIKIKMLVLRAVALFVQLFVLDKTLKESKYTQVD
jgi:hypothetical protein